MIHLPGSYFLETAHIKGRLREHALSGGIVTGISQTSKIFLLIISSAVMGRLLTPDQHGIIEMVTVVLGFVALAKDLGLSMATVQKEEINHQQVSTLFWINVAVSIVLMVLVIGLAPGIVYFYKERRLFTITCVLSLGFLFSGVSVQHLALLKRQMLFTRLAVIEIIALAMGIAVGIVSAVVGFGYWAIVTMLLATELTTSLGAWFLCSWRPSLPVRNSNIRSLIIFGGNVTYANIVNYLSRNLDNLLIGKYWGTRQLGFYAKAYRLLLFPLQQVNVPISSVAIPTLSRLQNEPERYRHYYCQAVKLIAFITMPLTITLGVLSSEIVFILLGKQWVESGVIFGILAFAGFIQPVMSTVGWVYISLGQTDRMKRWVMVFTPLQILSFIIGLPWGARGVALAYTVCTYLILFPVLWAAYRFSPISISSVVRAIWRPLVSSLIAGVVLFLVRQKMSSYSPGIIVFVCCGVTVVTWIGIIFIWSGLKRDVIDFITIVRMTIKKNSGVIAKRF